MNYDEDIFLTIIEGADMSSEQNKALARRFWEEVINGANHTVLDEIVAVDYIQHQADIAQGRAGLKQFVSAMAAAFPDQHATIEDIVSEGDRVVTRTSIHATHTGPLGKIPATGKPIVVHVIDIWRVVDGLLAEHWGIVDSLGMMQQLDVIPSPR
jgi:predicted ester cyclase